MVDLVNKKNDVLSRPCLEPNRNIVTKFIILFLKFFFFPKASGASRSRRCSALISIETSINFLLHWKENFYVFFSNFQIFQWIFYFFEWNKNKNKNWGKKRKGGDTPPPPLPLYPFLSFFPCPPSPVTVVLTTSDFEFF